MSWSSLNCCFSLFQLFLHPLFFILGAFQLKILNPNSKGHSALFPPSKQPTSGTVGREFQYKVFEKEKGSSWNNVS